MPHIIAVVVFLIISALFCKQGLEGKVLYQHDIIQYEGASKDLTDYAQKHGQPPLWTNGMFGGMPTYQIGMPANNLLPHYVNNVLTLGLPKTSRVQYAGNLLQHLCLLVLVVVLIIYMLMQLVVTTNIIVLSKTILIEYKLYRQVV